MKKKITSLSQGGVDKERERERAEEIDKLKKQMQRTKDELEVFSSGGFVSLSLFSLL
jgi:hypothetical protein